MLKSNRSVKRTDKGYDIYALIDPRDSSVCYVGLSINAQIRFQEHIKLSNDGTSTQKKQWILELR
jgi:hypothetical protein